MKKIRVKTIFGNHQIYQEIANHPPSNVDYLGISDKTVEGKYYQDKKWKEGLGRLLQKLHLPRMIVVLPGEFEIIHSSRGIIPLTTKPWVMDIEHVHSFFGLNPRFIKNRFWKKFIENRLASKNCKAILCHCEATRQAFFHFLDCSRFKEKIRVLYPSSEILPLKKPNHPKIRILSIVSDFECKAGPQILEAFSRLEKKYENIELWFRADVPRKFKEKYSSKKIIYMGYLTQIIPREKLLIETYSQCDIFLYPTLADSFGYSLIDALVAGLPIIGTNLFAVPEIVEHQKNGLVFDLPGYSLHEEFLQRYPLEKVKKNEEEIIKKIEENLEILIKDEQLREKMGKESFRLISEGKFSLQERNKQLEKIYLEASQ